MIFGCVMNVEIGDLWQDAFPENSGADYARVVE